MADKTITIEIKGIGLCYKKASQNVRKVLFPFDDCHLVKFSYRIADGPRSEEEELGVPMNQIVVSALDARLPVRETTSSFDNYVLDMTKSGLTHDGIKKTANWNQTAVLLTIPERAVFSVDGYVQELSDVTDNKPFLRCTVPFGKKPIFTHLAHSLTATITLPATSQLTVSAPSMPSEFSTEGNNSYTLTFDNDCNKVRHKNDMEMLYNYAIVDADPDFPDRKFLVEGPNPIAVAGKSAITLFSIPPSLRDGKPCMMVKASNTDDLP